MKTHYSSILGDGCCLSETATFRAILPELESDDIVYISYKNSIMVTPFAVCIDRSRSTIVVSIRGSASVADFLTDAITKPQSILDLLKGTK